MHFWSFLAQFSLEWEMFQTQVLEKIKTHFMFRNFCRKIVSFLDNVEKCCKAGKATDDNKAHVHCMLDT